MWRFTEDGLQRPSLTFGEVVALLRRPKPLPDPEARKCWDRACGRRAIRDGFLCEPHEIERRIDMYDRDNGWSA